MSGATATATPAPAKAAEKQKAAPSLIDEIMAKTTDLRTVMGAKWGVPKDQIIRYVRSFIGLWKGAPEGYELPWEVAIQFLTVCRELDLNPAKKECAAFFNPEKQGLQTFVMVDGWITMANRHPAYDGYEFKHERDPRGTLEAVTCLIYRKDRSRPIPARVKMSEWRVGTSPQWQGKPEWMLEMKGIKQACRLAFGFAGVQDDDEAAAMFGEQVVKTIAPQTTLDQLAPASPPPADEYSRPTAAPTMRQQEAESAAYPVTPAVDSPAASRAKLEAPAERKPEPAPVVEGPIEPDVLTRDEKLFVRMLGKKRCTSKVGDMNDSDMQDARDAAEATLHDPEASRAEKAHAAGSIVLLEAEAVARAGKA
jgi:hypothetical protein